MTQRKSVSVKLPLPYNCIMSSLPYIAYFVQSFFKSIILLTASATADFGNSEPFIRNKGNPTLEQSSSLNRSALRKPFF